MTDDPLAPLMHNRKIIDSEQHTLRFSTPGVCLGVLRGAVERLAKLPNDAGVNFYLDGTTVTIVVTHRHATDVSAAPVENGVRA